jgi:DNA-binding MarR family transcriptional regulator
MPDVFHYAPYLKDGYVFLLLKAHNLTYKRAQKILRRRGLKVQPRDIWVIAVASDHGLKQKTVADLLGINANSMVKIVDRLEKEHLIRRIKNQENRREYILSATPKGRKIVEDWKTALLTEVTGEILHPLTGSEQRELNSVLYRLICG